MTQTTSSPWQRIVQRFSYCRKLSFDRFLGSAIDIFIDQLISKLVMPRVNKKRKHLEKARAVKRAKLTTSSRSSEVHTGAAQSDASLSAHNISTETDASLSDLNVSTSENEISMSGATSQEDTPTTDESSHPGPSTAPDQDSASQSEQANDPVSDHEEDSSSNSDVDTESDDDGALKLYSAMYTHTLYCSYHLLLYCCIPLSQIVLN